MITPILEKLILRGDANYTVVSHAYGMFGRIPCPDGKIIIIEKIIWYPFLNPIKWIVGGLTWNQFFQYCEYQLKIDGKKTITKYQFRNALNVTLSPGVTPINWDAAININDFQNVLLQPGEPIIIDTFLVCTDHIKLTISRNDCINDFAGSTYGILNERATEQPSPNGMGGVGTLLELVQKNIDATRQYLNPPSTEYDDTLTVNPQYRENYSNMINPSGSGLATGANSQLQLPANDPTFFKNFPYSTMPLITFGIVYINENAASNLQSTT